MCMSYMLVVVTLPAMVITLTPICLHDISWLLQVVVVAEADPASIPLEDRADLHVKPDPDDMVDGHTNGVEIKASTPPQNGC